MHGGIMQNPKDLIDALMKVEGLKVQVNRAQMSEIVREMSELAYARPESVAILIQHGKKSLEKAVGMSIDEMSNTIEKCIEADND